MAPMIECLKFSPLSTALTISKEVPLTHLSGAFVSSSYDKEHDHIKFTIADKEVIITKELLSSLLKLPSKDKMVQPHSIQATTVLNMFHQMGFDIDMVKISDFKKLHLPPHWNGLFTILFRALSKRYTGSDSHSLEFYTLMYAMYYDINYDYGQLIWAQFQSNIIEKKSSQISFARFWSVLVDHAITLHKIPLMTDSMMAPIATLSAESFKTSDANNFDYIGSIPVEMTDKVPLDNSVLTAYRKLPLSEARPIPDHLQKAWDSLDKKTSGKRKASSSEITSPKRIRRLKAVQSRPISAEITTEDPDETDADEDDNNEPSDDDDNLDHDDTHKNADHLSSSE